MNVASPRATRQSLWPELAGGSFSLGYIMAGPIRTRLMRAGEHGEPLLLLHGVGGHLEAYNRNIVAHGEHFRTVAIDMIGHGFSDKPDRDYELPDYVEHVRDVCDALGFDRVHISGESLGGWVAVKFAAAYPERVNKLVLNTAGGLTANPTVMAAIKQKTLAAVADASYETVKARLEWLMHDAQSVTADLIEMRYAIYRQPGFLATMARIMCLQDMEIRRRNLITDDELRGIRAKTLVVWTTHDPTGAVEVGERFAGTIPDAELFVMDHCGHWPQFEDAPTFNSRHIAFLKGSS
jgi:2-hydroxy-6-oxonona-2,4-dienedioate hydrolase